MQTARVTLLDMPADGLPDLLRRAATDATVLLALSAEIYDLESLSDANRLTDLRDRLRSVAREMRAQQTDNAPALGVARTLLDQVAARQSPVGAALYRLLREDLERFTPALVRALWQTQIRARTLEQLFGPTPEDTAESGFLTDELVRFGVLVRTRTQDTASSVDRYRLTPAGSGALDTIARVVLELELGRFPWPEGVVRPQEWASREGVVLYEFQHEGGDGAKVAACVGEAPSRISSLSMPHLLGVAGRQQRAPSPYTALAVLWGEAEQWTDADLHLRTEDILDDHYKLCQRVDTAEKWGLTVFAGDDMVLRYGDQLLEECKEANVRCAFAA